MLFLPVNVKLAKLSATCIASFRGWLFACMLIAGFASPARGVLWDGGGSTSAWIEPANWQFNALPTTADTATIVSDVATIDALVVPTVMAVELGMGSLPGGLIITGGSAYPRAIETREFRRIADEVAAGMEYQRWRPAAE